MGYDSHGFELVNTFDPNTYPKLRAKRSGPPSPSADPTLDPGASLTLPQSRVFAFSLTIGAAALRSSTSSPKLKGPAMVLGLHVTANGAPNGNLGFGLGKNASPISESSVPSGGALPFTPLFTGLPQQGIGPSSSDQTDVSLDVQQPVPLLDDDSLRILIPETDFFLIIYCSQPGGAGRTLVGHVTLLEQCNRQSLAYFVG